ncbi:MAG: hypothetical protein AB1634_13940 [Thermodesulfobacteriota bacterium]
MQYVDLMDLFVQEDEEDVQTGGERMHALGEIDSPITGLKQVVLSMDWEITDQVMDRFDREVLHLERLWQDQRLLLAFLRILRALGKHVATHKARAHPEAIRLLYSVYNSLERVVLSPGMSDQRKKELVQGELDRYNALKGRLAGGPAAAAPPRPATAASPAGAALTPALAHLEPEPAAAILRPQPIAAAPEVQARLDDFFGVEAGAQPISGAEEVVALDLGAAPAGAATEVELLRMPEPERPAPDEPRQVQLERPDQEAVADTEAQLEAVFGFTPDAEAEVVRLELEPAPVPEPAAPRPAPVAAPPRPATAVPSPPTVQPPPAPPSPPPPAPPPVDPQRLAALERLQAIVAGLGPGADFRELARALVACQAGCRQEPALGLLLQLLARLAGLLDRAGLKAPPPAWDLGRALAADLVLLGRQAAPPPPEALAAVVGAVGRYLGIEKALFQAVAPPPPARPPEPAVAPRTEVAAPAAAEPVPETLPPAPAAQPELPPPAPAPAAVPPAEAATTGFEKTQVLEEAPAGTGKPLSPPSPPAPATGWWARFRKRLGRD